MIQNYLVEQYIDFIKGEKAEFLIAQIALIAN
jgi:hypothetical protein